MNRQNHFKAPLINARDVLRLESLQQQKRALAASLDEIIEEIKALEARMIQALDQGAESPRGVNLEIKVVERRYPSWKEHYTSALGAEAARAILEQTSPTVTRSLLVVRILRAAA